MASLTKAAFNTADLKRKAFEYLHELGHLDGKRPSPTWYEEVDQSPDMQKLLHLVVDSRVEPDTHADISFPPVLPKWIRLDYQDYRQDVNRDLGTIAHYVECEIDLKHAPKTNQEQGAQLFVTQPSTFLTGTVAFSESTPEGCHWAQLDNVFIEDVKLGDILNVAIDIITAHTPRCTHPGGFDSGIKGWHKFKLFLSTPMFDRNEVREKMEESILGGARDVQVTCDKWKRRLSTPERAPPTTLEPGEFGGEMGEFGGEMGEFGGEMGEEWE